LLYAYFQEFEVTLEKVGGSLGFTLRQEDSSILGHYVRALVKDPALTDGRIQPGDRILSVSIFCHLHSLSQDFLHKHNSEGDLSLFR
jgi:C-terminal processing protease CtpA/Prc